MAFKYVCAFLGLLLLSFTSPTAAAGAVAPRSAPAPFPNGPFTTNDSTILGADGSPFVFAGVNWPGAEVVMVPEGLQYQSIATIVSRIKSLGMNSIRLTYATEMIDQIYTSDMADITIKRAFMNGLGVTEGMKVLRQVLNNNPDFGETTTRLEVYDAIAAECAKQGIYVHLDNHVSKASWCCDPFDGNTWWNDTFFSPTNWTRGLSFMAEHAKQWPNLISMSLYNELRPTLSLANPDLMDSYNWDVWYSQIQSGSQAVHAANPDALIFLSGLHADTDLSPVVNGTAFTPGTATFSRDDFPGYGDKLVLELHSYDIVVPVTDCPSYEEGLMQAGYAAAAPADSPHGRQVAKNRFPVVMTEWGFKQDDSTLGGPYATCVQGFLGSGIGSGFMVWALGGSYYIRQEKVDADESWGLMNHEWSKWRMENFIETGLKPLVKRTLASAA